MTTKSDIVDRVKNRVQSVPSSLTDTMIGEYVEDAEIEIEKATGQTIDISDIPDKFRPLLTNLSCLYLIIFRLGGGADSTDIAANLNLGEGVSVDYGSRGLQGFTEREIQQINFFKERVNSSLIRLDNRQNFGFSDPGQRI